MLGYEHPVRGECKETLISFSHTYDLARYLATQDLGLRTLHADLLTPSLRRHAVQTCERTSCRFGNKLQSW
jgi:hypothetical protein